MKFLFVSLFLSITTLTTFDSDNVICSYKISDQQLDNLCDLNPSDVSEKNIHLQRIVDQLGLPMNFKVMECSDLDNAIAVISDSGSRYIMYDSGFISDITTETNAATVSILAHEVGHHLIGHTGSTKGTLKNQRLRELEADSFSGYMMAVLGYSLSEAQIAMESISFNGFDLLSTHPSRDKRLKAIQKGYQEGMKQHRSRSGLNKSFNDIIRIILDEKG